MKFSSALLIATTAAVAQAHATVYGIWVNDVDQGSGCDGSNGYIRCPPNNNPVKDLTSSAVACNVNNSPVAKTVPVKSGDKITFEWKHDNRGDDIIAESHHGPIVVYLAPTTSNGAGNVWVPIAKDGYSGGSWAVDKLRANKGKHSAVIPKGLAAGKYLLRAEILALHESDTLFSQDPVRGIQLYPSCSQIEVTIGGSVKLPAGVAFPGAYKDSDAGIHFDLYSADPNSYKVPGPAVWNGASDGSEPIPAPAPAPASSVPASAASSASSPSKPTVKPTTSRPAGTTLVTKASSHTAATPTHGCGSTGPSGKKFNKWEQCGGLNFKETGSCVNSKCVKQNDYYHQCL